VICTCNQPSRPGREGYRWTGSADQIQSERLCHLRSSDERKRGRKEVDREEEIVRTREKKTEREQKGM
jgi:hypothetical protein